jgi:hypothetical protein
MTTVQIADPNARTLYDCFFVGAKKTICELKTYIPMTPAVNTTGKTVSGDLPEKSRKFELPTGFKVTDIRQTAAPGAN